MRRYKGTTPDDIALEMVRYRVRKMRRFFMHIVVYTIAMILYLAKTYCGAPFNFWPIHFLNSFFMWVWTFFVIVQAIKLFLREKVFGIDWEQRKLREFMNQEKQNKWE